MHRTRCPRGALLYRALRVMSHARRVSGSSHIALSGWARSLAHMDEINAAREQLLNRDVEIVGLVRAPGYNGRVGVAYAFDADEGGLHHIVAQ